MRDMLDSLHGTVNGSLVQDTAARGHKAEMRGQVILDESNKVWSLLNLVANYRTQNRIGEAVVGQTGNLRALFSTGYVTMY